MELALQQGGLGRLVGEWLPSGEGLVQRDPELVDIGDGPNGFAAELRGRCVGRRPGRERGGRVGQFGASEGDAEVGQVGVAVLIEQDVGGCAS